MCLEKKIIINRLGIGRCIRKWSGEKFITVTLIPHLHKLTLHEIQKVYKRVGL